MSVEFLNHNKGMLQNQCQTLQSFGKDQSNQITYQFNQQGFRSHINFNFIPDYAFFGCSLVFGIGVPDNKIFASYFKNSQNYGLAGSYDNHDIMHVLEKFLSSNFWSDRIKIAVVWHSRDSDCLEDFYNRLQNYNIVHFYCGDPLLHHNCFAFPPEVDQDVSGSHPGPKTHHIFYRMLCAVFNQL